MTRTRPIDQKRDSALAFEVGTLDEGVTSSSMVPIGGLLYIFKERAIYAIQMVDQVDPGRKNFDLSKVIQRRVLSEGSASKLVGRTLLTVINLVGKGQHLPPPFQHERTLVLSIEALISLVAMRTTGAEFDVAQQEAYANSQAASHTAGSMLIPSMSDVGIQCKTFSQRADHTARLLFAIVQLFYADLGKGGWEALLEHAASVYGGDDSLTNFVREALPFLLLVRNSRDCLEHDLAGTTVTDFTVRPDGQLVPPTIEIDFRNTQQPAIAISQFMAHTLASMITVFEVMLAHLCSKHVSSRVGGIEVVVAEVPQESRREKHVRFYCGTYFGEQFVPMG